MSFPSANRPIRPVPRGAAADLWRHTLSQIPSVFGQLVYLASLRDANSGEYRHHGLAAVFGDHQAQEAIRNSHQQVFARWLEMPLAEQKADLVQYVTGLEPGVRQVVSTWSRLEPYRNLPPESALSMEKELFLADLEALLSLLRNELGVALPDPDA